MPRLTLDQLLALSREANFEWETITQYIDTSDWIKILKELGFVEVGGRWVKMIPSYASTVKQSVNTAGAVAGTTATIYETVTSPVSKIIASNTGTKVTTSGILTATSTSVGAAACAGALGFVTGVNWFESAPEFWTKVSNAVFQTDLDPKEIGRIARDTNAVLMIKEGLCYMAEDLVKAFRDAFFDNGAAGVVSAPDYPSATDRIEITTTGGGLSTALALVGAQAFVESKKQYMTKESLDTYNEFLADSDAFASASFYISPDGSEEFLQITGVVPTFKLPATVTVYKGANSQLYETDVNGKVSYNLYIYGNSASCSKSLNTSNNVVRFGVGTTPGVPNGTQYWAGSANTAISYIDGITPTGEQGTKEQTLDEVFPDWVAKAVTTIGDFPDTIRRWLPLTLPSTLVETQGNPLTTTQAQTGALPEDETEAAVQIQSNTDTKTTTQTGEALSPTPLPIPLPTITPTPDTPSISGGGGSATGLANLYNPTLAQIKQFSRWLWGSDGLNLDQLKKLLQDPMQAIIGLHVMYATPTTGANRDIQVGYINSGVPSKIVTEQYTEINCGTVRINEYFGDARDYSPYTQVYCYLPFIGIVELNADDVVNSTLGIKYKIDVLTGCCLAQLTVKKYGLNAVLYTYTGNCAVQMPITSGNYLSTVSSLLGAVVSGAAAVATGGALAPVAIGAAANAMGGGARASVAMSGSLGSNAGAMGIRKPYLIIKRVESADANGYNEFYGYPTNKRVNLSQLSGYVRVKEINLSGTNATEDEQNEIVALLKEGVIL